jgi:hypothetical protein
MKQHESIRKSNSEQDNKTDRRNDFRATSVRAVKRMAQERMLQQCTMTAFDRRICAL